MAVTSDELSLWRAVEGRREEDAVKLALADWLDEHDKPAVAATVRWCVRNRRWPRPHYSGGGYIWTTSSHLNSRSGRLTESLPAPLCRLTENQKWATDADDHDWHNDMSLQGRIYALAAVQANLRRLLP